MKSLALTPDDYLNELPEDRKIAMGKLRALCVKNIKGAQEIMAYGMLTYAVPLSVFPAGYHCTPGMPLMFISIASQKNFIAIYHMGIYAYKPLLDWFIEEYPKYCTTKLDMGKSCLRFKKMEDIPYKFLEALLKKMTLKDWVKCYEAAMVTGKYQKVVVE
jgi:Domain of unknown function (DU1801)